MKSAWRTTFLLVLGALLAGCGRAPDAARDADAASTADSATYKRTAWYVPMEDGVRLAITVYTPAGAAADSRFPVLLWYMPGHRENIDPATGRLTPAWSEEDLEFFTAQGYALAAAEMRGSGASYGTRVLDRGPQIGRDGKALVDWVAAQSWSDGRVGMVGSSYQGFSQYATAAERPAALRAIFPEIAGFDDYTSMFHPGGIQVVALSSFATASIVRDDQNFHEPGTPRPRLPSAPVIDEDGDGELADEIPLDRDGSGSFLDDGDPTYRDGSPRQHIYFEATREHVANSNLTVEILAAAPWRDSKLAGTTWDYRDMDPGERAQRIAASGIAVYNRGGWYDYHARDTVMWHATLAGHTPTFLMMAPTGHGGFPASNSEELYRAGPYFRLFADSTSTHEMLNREKLAFFDRYVRGIDNGFDERPPVRLYVMNEGWRDEAEWPLARQRLLAYHFAAGGQLTTVPGAAGSDRHEVDLTADARSGGASRWNFGVSGAREPLSLDGDAARRLQYTTAPLTADMEVTGHPLLTVALSSTAANGDLFAYLEDVGPDGRSLLVTEGQLRLNYPAEKPVQEIIAGPAGTVRVRPELPWHGFTRAEYVDDPLADGRVRTYRFDLLPTAWVFRAGHRIRLSLAGADAPSFALHPDGDTRPVWTVRRGAGLSRLELPVIPEQP
ncbi:MAG TPA: CocE/NonD family hydrolase [Steroidobacteraceae bacterium]|nr:CocE/NonD family hydrolase [Steroidobacteraceae bacterium]